jgi:uncharacterized protein
MIGIDWSKEKAEQNYAKHSVRFEDAIKVFDDPNALFIIDERFDYNEERFAVIGSNGIRILFVVHTENQDVIRIISARHATKGEMDAYFKNTFL